VREAPIESDFPSYIAPTESFSHCWAPISTPAVEADYHDLTRTLDNLMKSQGQHRRNAILWLRFIVAMLQRDEESAKYGTQMLRRLNQVMGGFDNLLTLIFERLADSINAQEDARKARKRRALEDAEEREEEISKANEDEAAKLLSDWEVESEQQEKKWQEANAMRVEMVLLLQKLLSLVRGRVGGGISLTHSHSKRFFDQNPR
jgi:hypothetical protein